MAKAVSAAIRSLSAQGDRIDRLTFAGHGEPTLHPKFRDVVAAVRKVRDELAPGVPIAVLSNASTLERADVCAALAELDERYMKLDAGDQDTLRHVNACAVSIDLLVASLRALSNVVVQTMFVRDETGRIGNTSDRAVSAWLEALLTIRPEGVHIYTLDRPPAWPGFRPVEPSFLAEVAGRVRAAGLRPLVFTR